MRVLHSARRNSSTPRGRTTESWSATAKRASRSLGAIRSNPLKSMMLPQRLATWLSATRKEFPGMAPMSAGIVWRLKIPCRKSLNTTASIAAPSTWTTSWRRTRSEMDRLSSVSILTRR